MRKSYGNSDTNGAKKNVHDLTIYGESDMFKLISKASSDVEKWSKSTKAMEIHGVGCIVQVSTQQGDNVAEAVCFVPGVRIVETKSEDGVVVSRKLVQLNAPEVPKGEILTESGSGWSNVNEEADNGN